MDKHYKVSFCTTCKGRLEHLKQTLPENLKSNEDYPDTEFVILDYDSRDGLEEWIRENFKEEIRSGKIRYAKYSPAPHFKVAHAKNLAHLLATGDILCNLDADNFTGKDENTGQGFASWLNQEFSRNPDIIVKPHGNSLKDKIFPPPRLPRGYGEGGRIALLRDRFDTLRGYDERYTGHGKDDTNLTYRARRLLGLKRVDVPGQVLGKAIPHSNDERIENIAPEDQEKFKLVQMRAKQTSLGGTIPIGKLYKLGHKINLAYKNTRKANADGCFGRIEQGATLRDIDNRDISMSLRGTNKVSFCITCKGRFEHLKQTLPENLKNNADYPNTEFVVLDYDSQDGLGEWIRENFREELKSGKIRYAKYGPAPHFKMAHAKNMAHNLATGDILCNLDADNITAPKFANWLNQKFSEHPDTYTWIAGKTFLHNRLAPKWPAGAGGRIAMLRKNFRDLRGYDERYIGWGGDDNNLVQRAQLSGLKYLRLPQEMYGSVIPHDNDMRVNQMPPETVADSMRQLEEQHLPLFRRVTSVKMWRRRLGIHAVPPLANSDGRFGCVEEGASLRDINHQEIVLPPYVPSRNPGGPRRSNQQGQHGL